MSEPRTCTMCDELIVIDCGYEAAKHSYCYQCASIKLDEILNGTLDAFPDERHLRPQATKARDGTWVQAPALGCVRPQLARAFAAELLRACDEAEA